MELDPVPGDSVSDSGEINSAFGGISLYQGTETFTITPVASQGFSLGGDSGASFSGTPASATGTVSIEYEFKPNPIPEPPSAILTGLALGLLIILRKRYRVNSGNPLDH